MNLSALIEEFQSKGGAIRKFERGEAANREALTLYLQRRGYRLSLVRGSWQITSATVGRPRRRTWNDVITFVDRIRAEEGKQPIRRVA